ncbi:protein phosphatase 1 regulatory subunit 16A [Ctenocephalides felis]|uniref:protein phosphatase 1 regulatory subunit 16A n=1 Tax=Ctenocephalides felis TaxID=7515 RepID=UPI000E6E256A|nr:protein phosphatase 1 regulatory subunit 16A [Ctenocephalides felis]
MEHAELVNEMAHIEHLTNPERLQLARLRRVQQIKLWKQREKEWMRQHGKKERSSNKPHIYFSDGVMLLEAAARNDVSEVRRLLQKGVTPDATNEDGLTALHQCCIDDNEEMLRLLLEYGADVNAQDSERWTPLHAAATCAHLHLVRYLIARGANLLAVNADGNMPYDICEDDSCLDYIESEMARRGVTQELIDETRAATETKMLEDLQIIAAAGGDLEVVDHQGATPLHIAAANGYIRVVEFLLDQHVSTDPKDHDLWQPVHAAACWGHLEVLEMLVHNGADLNAKNRHEETPADICEDPELRERIKHLRTEQESKRLQEQQRKRVRRSQSNNTRTQSVRRTSIRDKTLTTKKDTAEEAKLRLQAQEWSTAHNTQSFGNSISRSINNNNVYAQNGPQYANTYSVNMPNNSNGVVVEPINNSIVDSTDFGARRAPEGKDNDSFIMDNSNISSMISSECVEIPTETFSTSDNNGKINVHVTVMINSGTLAELKKQRAQTRQSSEHSSPASPTNSQEPGLVTDLVPVNAITGTNTNTSDVSPGVLKFSGNTGEVVGDSSSHSCCIIL